MSGTLNIAIEPGATRRITFAVTVDGEPYDFTGATVTFAAGRVSTDLDITGNVLSLNLTPAMTRGLSGAKYVIDMTWPGGDVNRLLHGNLRST